ncbi:MAG: hydrogenase [Candidatus Omnitrophica bacterium]|nr:hydrogenase [Candidatus Omnitrophota bacterium]
MEIIFSKIWQVPFGALSLRLDPLSVLFLTAITILFFCAGIYSMGYLRPYQGKKPLVWHVFCYLFLAMMFGVVVTANNVILFLSAWELMSIATYFLIIFHDETPSVRRAGFLYLMATHCGTFCLFLMFFLMAHTAGSMNFDVMAHASFSPVVAGTIFSLALIGFGVKAGFLPFHIWLPHAHPAAPSHISAVLSGVAIKTGIYGICRVLWIMGVLPEWCGYALLLIGVVSGLMGVLYALGQHELKKLLAYHSIENIGIIAIGLGIGMLGRTYHLAFVSALGFAGALLHVLNHALFKGLLFLGAGSVIQKTHTGDLDRLGGLAKIMPYTSVLFLVGALSICGLPLFNGFISEFVIFYGLFQGLLTLPLQGVFSCGVGIVSLALMGALALACFAKVYGTIFLGKPRRTGDSALFQEKERNRALSPVLREATSKWMIVAMAVLAGLCAWIGLAPRNAVRLTFAGGEYLSRGVLMKEDFEKLMAPLSMIIGTVFIFMAVIAVLVLVRKVLLGKGSMPIQDTWACGFAQVSPKFQYTSSSFARPIVELMKKILMFSRQGGKVVGEFPVQAHMISAVKDASEEGMFRPLYIRFIRLSRKLDERRNKYTQMYLMYIFLFLIFLLIWKLR